jgi:hypothetical protein
MFCPIFNSLTHLPVLLSFRVIDRSGFQTLVEFFMPSIDADTAYTRLSPIRSHANLCRRGRIFVAVLAVSLSRILRAHAFTPQNVYPIGHGVDVDRIHAQAHAAQVVAFQGRRKLANEDLKHQPMHGMVSPPNTDRAVTFDGAPYPAPPFPARHASVRMFLADMNSREDSGEQGSIGGYARTIVFRHIASMKGDVFRLVGAFQALRRAACILTHGPGGGEL